MVRAGDVSTEFCGGTHIDNTGKLGLFKIVSESSVAAGVRRIEGVTGTGVLDYIAASDALVSSLVGVLKLNSSKDVLSKVSAIISENKELSREVADLKSSMAAASAQDLISSAVSVGPVKLVTSSVPDVAGGDLRSMADSAVASDASLVCVFASVSGDKLSFACACGPEAVAAGAHAGNLVRGVAAVAGGSGGGKPDSAMAGGKDASKVDEALVAAASLLADMVG